MILILNADMKLISVSKIKQVLESLLSDIKHARRLKTNKPLTNKC